MAWNSGSNKSLQNILSGQQKAANISVGAPVSYSPSLSGNSQGYHDNWDITKAYREGVAKVTWVFRCIDVIASNQARCACV